MLNRQSILSRFTFSFGSKIQPNLEKYSSSSSSECDTEIAEEQQEIEASILATIQKQKIKPYLLWSTIPSLTYPEALSKEYLAASARDNRGNTMIGSMIYDPPLGTILAVGSHDITVLFIPRDVSKFVQVSGKQRILVKRGTPRMEWILRKPEIIFGTPLDKEDHFTCRCLDLKGGEYVYSHYIGDILFRGITKMTCQFKPDFNDAENYKNGYMSTSISIVSFPPPIDWPEIDDIIYPTPLTKQQLNARSAFERISGLFLYTPTLEVLLPVGVHTINVKFTPTRRDEYQTVYVTRQIRVLKGSCVLQWDRPVSVFEGQALSEFSLSCKCVTPAKLPGLFIYDPPLGTLLKAGTHQLSCVFEPTDSASFLTARKSVNIVVHPQMKPLIYWPDTVPLSYPSPLTRAQLSASVSGLIPGVFIYDPPLGTVLSVGTHKLSVEFVPSLVGKASSTMSTTVEVSRGVPRLLWNKPDAILEGNSLSQSELNCKCTNLSGGKFKYDPGVGAVLEAGNHVVKVEYTPDDKDNYVSGASLSVIQQIRARIIQQPDLKWAAPLAISYSTPLGDKQLNAHTTVNGVIHYTPNRGTILSVGTHVLKALFQPQFSKNYMTARAQVTIEVLKSPSSLTWSATDEIIYGTPLAVDNVLTVFVNQKIPGAMSYTPPPGTILDNGCHIVHCLFTPADSLNYYPSEISTEILVRRAVPILAWQEPEPISYPCFLEKSVHLSPVCVSVHCMNGRFELSHEGGTILPAGQHTLSCRYYPIPSDIINFYSADAQVTLTVNQGIPAIQWRIKNKSLTFGNPLTTIEHLCGTADVEGTFEYCPSVGSYLSVGNRVPIRMTFTPFDTHNYATVSEIRYLRVTKSRVKLDWSKAVTTLTFGDPLEKCHLCCEVSVAENCSLVKSQCEFLTANGSWVYDPPLGTLLEAGDEVPLRVVYRPPSCYLARRTGYSYADTVLPNNDNTNTTTVELSAVQDDGTDAHLTSSLHQTTTATAANNASSITNDTVSNETKFHDNSNNQNFSSKAKLTILVRVLKAKPKLIFPQPTKPILYGTALDLSWLSARVERSDVFRGYFIYSPLMGTVLAVGRKQVEVTFVPDSPMSLAQCRATVFVEVIKDTPRLMWGPLEAVSVGHRLNRRQLCAVAVNNNYAPASTNRAEKVQDNSGADDDDNDDDACAVDSDGGDDLAESKSRATGVINDDNNQHKDVDEPKSSFLSALDLFKTFARPKIIAVNAINDATDNDANNPNNPCPPDRPPIGFQSRVTGDYLYSPALGTCMLRAGATQLSVQFTPTGKDAQYYHKSSWTTVTLTVWPSGSK